MPDSISLLDRYLQRIGYSGSREPTFATLKSLHQHHVQSIPFENLDILLGRRISIDPDAVREKLINQHRGGYCFEHNTLFHEILRTLEFSVTPLLSRVRWMTEPGTVTPRTHMVLRVDLNGTSWLADVGFGGIGTTEPLALDSEEEQITSHDSRRLLRTENGLLHQVRIDQDWHDVYLLSLEPPPRVDFELGNWYSCTHPRATFVNNLVTTRVTPTGRIVIYNHKLTIREIDGSTTTESIHNPEELRQLLARHFELQFPAGTTIPIPEAPWPH